LNPEWTRTGGPEDARILAKKINVILLEQLTAKDLLEAIERAPTIEIRSTTNGAELLSRRLLEMLRA
jgi:hypothetical protein